MQSLHHTVAMPALHPTRPEAGSFKNKRVSLAQGGNSFPANQWHHAYQTVSTARVGSAERLSDGWRRSVGVLYLSTPEIPSPPKISSKMPIALFILLLSSPTKNHHIELSFVPAAAGDPPFFPGHECGRRQERLRQVQPVRCRPVLPPPQSQVSHPPNGEFFFGVVLAFVDVHLVCVMPPTPKWPSPELYSEHM